jgi:hypothetical protein
MRVGGALIKTRLGGFIPMFANKKEAEDQAFGKKVLRSRRL